MRLSLEESIKTISVVIPMYFEEQVVDECHKRLTKVMGSTDYLYELIYVNDGSKDRTLEMLDEIAKNDRCVKVISFSRNFGHQNAVTAGIDYAKGDAIVIIDADLQDPPEVIPLMIKKWEDGDEIIYGKRLKRDGETPFKLVTAKAFYRFLDTMAEVEIPRDTGDFRLIDRKVAEVFKMLPERNRFIRGMFAWVGFKQSYVEYNRDARFAGNTKYPLKKMLSFAMNGIFSFSSKPLKLISHIGVFAVFISVLILLYSLISLIADVPGLQPGWASIMVTLTFFGGIQLICVGLIGAYVARIYDEIKGRPQYIVTSTINIDDQAKDG
jgi:dolichol-phosphate mannosyltransferase